MKLVSIRITLETEVETGLRLEAHIFDCLFSEYNNLFNIHDLENKLKKAMKITKNSPRFMITFVVLEGQHEQAVTSRRFVYEYGELKTSQALNSGNFDNWYTCEHKAIKETLKYFTEQANIKFIELVKK